MAQDLGISEGVAGQSVTVTARLSRCFPQPVRHPDYSGDRQALYRYSVRRFADGFFCPMQFLPTAYAAIAGPRLSWVGAGRFWAMSASLTMRLVPARTVPKALSVILARFPSR